MIRRQKPSVDRPLFQAGPRSFDRIGSLAMRLGIMVSLLWSALGRTEVVTNTPFRGVSYLVRKEIAPRPLTMHIALIDLNAPGIGFKLTPPKGRRDTIRQTTLDFMAQEQAQLAINAHFFLPYPSQEPEANLVGFAASQGLIYSAFEPQPVEAGYVDQSYAILPFAPALNIDPFNSASIVHLDPADPDRLRVVEPVTVWNAVSGSAQIITDGVKTIPTYSGFPDGLNPIRFYDDAFSWYAYPDARTTIGLTKDNRTLVLFTVDEAGGSEGMTPGEVADLLIQDYAVYNAINLDGGGSTTMALQDPGSRQASIVNNPSDGPGGRATGSNLAVFAQRDGMELEIKRTNAGEVVISWPATASDWRLQGNADLARRNWEEVKATPQRVGDRLRVVVPPESGSQFYRLMKSERPGD